MFTQVEGKKRSLLFPSSKKSDKILLFLSGFPKYPEKNKFIDFFVNKNFNVLMPLYSGTFDSLGKFSIDNCVKDISTWYDYIAKENFFVGSQKNYKITPKEIIIFSHSFGSYIVDLALKKYSFKKIKTAIFLSPLYKPYLFINDNSKKISDVTFNMVTRNYPISYRFKNKTKFSKEIQGATKNILTELPLKTSLEKSIIIVGKDDIITPPSMAESMSDEYSNKNFYKVDGGHSSRINFEKFASIIDNNI